MSSFAQPTIAPNRSVSAPTATTAVCTVSLRLKMAWERAMR